MWGLRTAVTRSISTCFFPQCLHQVSSKVCNFVDANINDYKLLCNYLSHTSHLQIKWQLWAYTYAFLPLYFHHISAFESSHVIPCSYVHIMFAFTSCMSSIFTILFTTFHPFHPMAHHQRLLKAQPSPCRTLRRAHAKGWKVEPSAREVHGVHGTFFLGDHAVSNPVIFFGKWLAKVWDLGFAISLVQKYYVCWVPRDHATTLLFWQHRFRCFWQQEMITERGSTGRNTNTGKDWSWFEW